MIYLSRPSLWLPDDVLDNEAVLALARGRFHGDDAGWRPIERHLRLILRACRSRLRHKALDPAVRIADAATRAARSALAAAAIEPAALDLVTYAAIAREYLEPGTAWEVAGELGIEETRALDVSGACASQALGLANTVAWMRANDRIQRALVVGAEIGPPARCFDFQSVDELPRLGAGITIGDGASAWLLGREPFPGGSLRVVDVEILARPQHWRLSQAPLAGRFISHSSELMQVTGAFDLALRGPLDRVGWSLESVEQFILHQPGHALHQKMLAAFGLPPTRAINVHPRFGNVGSISASAAAAVYFEETPPPDGARIVLLVAGAGLAGAVILCENVA